MSTNLYSGIPRGGSLYHGVSANDYDFSDSMYESLSDPNLGGQYLSHNQEVAVKEGLSILDYPKAALTGAYHGLTITAPETALRLLHRFSKFAGATDMQAYAREKLDEYASLREYDPYYQPDPRWYDSYAAKSLYEGTNAIVNSFAISLPGLVAAPLTAGTSVGATLFGGALSGGLLGGFAEYDSFLDEAYKHFSKINPNVTRADIEDEHFTGAVLSGLAEGGLEFAGNLLSAKLMGLLSKGLVGGASAAALKGQAESSRTFLSRLFQNYMKSVLSEVPTEMATAGVQDFARKLEGMDHQGLLKSMMDSIGPTLVASGFYSAAGSAVQAATKPWEFKDNLNNLRNTLVDQAARDAYGEAGHKFLTEQLRGTLGLDEKTAHGVMGVLEGQAEHWVKTQGKDSTAWWGGLEAKMASNPEGALMPMLDLARVLSDSTATSTDVTNAASRAMLDSLPDALRKEMAEGFTTQFTDAEVSGEEGLVLAFSEWLRDPKLELPDNLVKPFEDMREALINTYEASSHTMPLNQASTEVFENIYKNLDRKTPETRPQMFQVPDPEKLTHALSFIPEGTSQDWQKEIQAFVKNTNFNFNPWTMPDDAKTIFAWIDDALSPYMGFLKKKSDAVESTKALQDMQKNGYDTNAIASLFGTMVTDDKGTLAFQATKAMFYQSLLLEQIRNMAHTANALPTVENMAALRVMVSSYLETHGMMRGIRAESGRLLRAFKNAGQLQGLDMQRLNALVDDQGGVEGIQTLATLIINSPDVGATLEKTAGAKFTDMLVEHATLGMLTNISTQVVNVFGNGLALVGELGAKYIGSKMNKSNTMGLASVEAGASISGLLRAFREIRKTFGEYRKTHGGIIGSILSEDAPQLYPQGNGFLDDAGIMTRSLTRQNAQDVIGVVKSFAGLSSDHGIISNGLSTMVEYYGRALGIVGKGLFTADKVFKIAAYHMELSARMARKASQEAALTGKDYQTLLEKYSARPPASDQLAALDYSKRMTFQQDLGKIGQSVNKMRSDFPLMRLVIPFLKTPINILKHTAAYTPVIGQMLQEVRAELSSGDHAARQMAEARMMVGTVIWAGALGLAAQGMLTGNGPSDPEERRKLMNTGWQPNSLKIGDTYIGIDRVDPLSLFLNSAASYYELSQYLDEKSGEMALSAGLAVMLRTVTNRTYLQSVQSFMDLIMDSDKPEGERALKQYLSNVLTPASALSRTTARVIDPVAREASGIFGQLRANIPGLSMTLPERRNMLGEVMKAPESWGPDYLSPFRVSEERNDPVMSELARLSIKGNSVPGFPTRVWQATRDKSIRLDDDQYNKYLDYSANGHRINGSTLRETLENMVQSSLYKRASDENKAEMLSNVVNKYRRQTRQVMMRFDSKIRALVGDY